MSEKIEVAKPDYLSIRENFREYARGLTNGQIGVVTDALTQAHADAQALAAAEAKLEAIRGLIHRVQIYLSKEIVAILGDAP
jgi:hypothetical protein